MEDTQKLTQFYSQEEMEAQLLDDFFRGRKFDGGQMIRWNRMRDGLFLKPDLSGFASDRVKGELPNAA